ncbi:phage major capsid protein, P2 family [Sphingomonas sp. PL-96]|uniref:phage major capsid protein, P2 family n=1 Tax=Sphingomonas sp. PL-96 TaxID=2887201 RepID=UPI001E3A892D|nr:phage major capsid protein, P2 family [Sphingomonas sp. PL-96]MCC2976256.1 phage major capsid protein, P2 family [Sphingomonas sp. PL-96]
MRNDTRELFNAYEENIASINGVTRVDKTFTVDPSVEQKLETRTQESSAFLSQINVFPVDELKGEKVGITMGGPIANRTDTSGNNRRNPVDPTGMDSLGYELAQTNFDTFLPYGKLDAWAKFPDFETRIQGAIVERIQLDRIMIGFNGVEAAKAHDPAKTLLQDMNIGWLAQMRKHNQIRVMDEGKTAGKVTVGAGGDYATVDALVWDAVQSLLPSWAKGRTDLVAICGAGLLHDKYFPLINQEEKPTEQIARDLILSSKRLGGRQAAEVPFMVDNAVLITPFKNLSLYYQNGKRRRHIVEEPQFNRVADYQSSNEGYVVEDFDLACMVENIEILPAPEA